MGLSQRKINQIIKIANGEGVMVNMRINCDALKKGYFAIYDPPEKITKKEADKIACIVPINKIK